MPSVRASILIIKQQCEWGFRILVRVTSAFIRVLPRTLWDVLIAPFVYMVSSRVMTFTKEFMTEAFDGDDH